MFRPLTLFNRDRAAPVRREDYAADPFFRLHDEMNRLFEDAFQGFGRGFGAPTPFSAYEGARAPSIDMRETDRAVEISAELPGVDEADLDVEVHDQTLTIRGEKKFERDEEEKDGGYRVMERAYGSFARTIPLPYPVEPDQVDARFRNGVLKLTLPKPAETEAPRRKIAIKNG